MCQAIIFFAARDFVLAVSAFLNLAHDPLSQTGALYAARTLVPLLKTWYASINTVSYEQLLSTEEGYWPLLSYCSDRRVTY